MCIRSSIVSYRVTDPAQLQRVRLNFVLAPHTCSRTKTLRGLLFCRQLDVGSVRHSSCRSTLAPLIFEVFQWGCFSWLATESKLTRSTRRCNDAHFKIFLCTMHKFNLHHGPFGGTVGGVFHLEPKGHRSRLLRNNSQPPRHS